AARPVADILLGQTLWAGYFLTPGTALGRRLEAIDCDQRSPVPLGLVGELPAEFSPTDIVNRLAVNPPRHAFDVQILDGNDLVLVNEPGGELVQDIGAG